MRTITKKQLQAITKVCSTDQIRPVLTRLMVQDGYLWATDGYVAVRYNLDIDAAAAAQGENYNIDPVKLKMKLAVMKPLQELTPDDLQELKDDEQPLRQPPLHRLLETTPDKTDGTLVPLTLDPVEISRATNALTIPRPLKEEQWFTITTYHDGHRLVLENKMGDLAIIMGGSND